MVIWTDFGDIIFIEPKQRKQSAGMKGFEALRALKPARNSRHDSFIFIQRDFIRSISQSICFF